MLQEEAAAGMSDATPPASSSSPPAAQHPISLPTQPGRAQALVLPSRRSSPSSGALTLPSRPTRPLPKPPAASASALSLSPLHALGAFGLASLGVVGLAAGGVWAVKLAVGVNDMDEFRLKARLMLGSALPGLSERVHRAVSPSERGFSAPPSPASPNTSTQPAAAPREDDGWTFAAAQERLAHAFGEGGVGRWAEQVEREMEAEREWEVRRRKDRLDAVPG
ncbi:hypothetical protein CALCODRAFT_503845 [Calocera cornea HHB12733]|uniref:Uncharacterized protein n=1 Tax=Calocera cornea HHB12733 TaxID=1353952 RepID=A0A165CQB0_9BASI|nr:hypothetical protein CALCODRAFT_503845 [Calocera cornea HHB12733]